MKKIVAVNASPRTTWNTAQLVREAARGAESAGAEVEVFDLYQLEKHTGCVSCFGCKLPGHEGACIYRDGLSPVLDAIRNADGFIVGSPNYLGNVTAGFRALYERLVFPCITYKTEIGNYNERRIPVLMIMTSNVPEERYSQMGYEEMLAKYQQSWESWIGPTKTMVCGNTLQVHDYEKYDWTMFDVDAKRRRHDEAFPGELKRAFALGAGLLEGE